MPGYLLSYRLGVFFSPISQPVVTIVNHCGEQVIEYVDYLQVTVAVRTLVATLSSLSPMVSAWPLECSPATGDIVFLGRGRVTTLIG